MVAVLGMVPEVDNFDNVYNFKVEVTGDTADTTFGNVFSDDNFAAVERVSPVVFYAYMTGREAVDLMARNKDFHIVRARRDWSI